MSRLQSIVSVSAIRGGDWKAGACDTQLSIYELLKADHAEIHNICLNILQEDDAGSEKVWNLFVELRELITSHTKIEELVFYNRIHDLSLQEQDDELRFDVMEGFEEHHLINLLLAEVAQLDRSSERWMVKMGALSENLYRHFEHEESEIFESAKRDLKSQEAHALAEEYLEEKDFLSQKAH